MDTRAGVTQVAEEKRVGKKQDYNVGIGAKVRKDPSHVNKERSD